MNKKILLLLIMFFAPFVVYADNVSLNCPDKINNDVEFTCELFGYTDTTVSSLSANITLSNGLSLVGFIPSRSWEGDGANGNIALYTLDYQKNQFLIGTIKIKKTNSDDSSISVNSVFFYDEEDKEKAISSISKAIKLESNQNNIPSNSNNNQNNNRSDNQNSNASEVTNNNNNNNDISSSTGTSYYLIDLKIDGYSLNFEREKTEYTLKINNETELSIIPILEDSRSTYEIIGNNNLENGSIIRIQIVTVDGNMETYRIKIEKDVLNKKKYTNIFIIVIIALILINILRIVMNERNKIGGAQE